MIGGLGSLVRNKTVTIKLNLTGLIFSPFLGRPPGETMMTHFSTALALGGLLLEAGARRVRFVESAPTHETLQELLARGGWDVKALVGLGCVEFENTRNLGQGRTYSQLKVPGGGLMFSSFQLNHAYADTDVMVSLCKLKQHVTAGVTLSMKNLFGLTPTPLYGEEAGSEGAKGGRGPLHGPGTPWDPKAYEHIELPGLKMKRSEAPKDPGARVPRIITDLCAARPIHLAVIDGITAMSGGEGSWCADAGELKFTTPGVIIAGLDPVAADAVGTAVMGFANPRAPRGTEPFAYCENHLLLAEQAGLGTADLTAIELLGLPLAQAIYPYRRPSATSNPASGRPRGPIGPEPE